MIPLFSLNNEEENNNSETLTHFFVPSAQINVSGEIMFLSTNLLNSVRAIGPFTTFPEK